MQLSFPETRPRAPIEDAPIGVTNKRDLYYQDWSIKGWARQPFGELKPHGFVRPHALNHFTKCTQLNWRVTQSEARAITACVKRCDERKPPAYNHRISF